MKRLLLSIALGLVFSLAFVRPVSAAEVADHLVISEIQTARSGDLNQEFIELYNPTSKTIYLDEWSIQYKSAQGEFSTIVVQPLGANKYIVPGGHFLLRPANQPADANYTFDLNETGGNVFLVRGTTAVASVADNRLVDRVGYGMLANSPEHAPAEAPNDTQSIERRPGTTSGEGNGIDTGNNNADFFVNASPNPQTVLGDAPQPAAGPTVSNVVPTEGSYLAQRTVAIEAMVSDAVSGVDADSINLLIDGEFHGPANYDPATGKVTRTVVVGEGTHTVRLTVSDKAGYTTVRSWVFTVNTLAPTLTLTTANSRVDGLSVTVNLVADDQPAGKASGVSEMRVAYDGVLDTEAWEPFQSTVTRNLMNKEGLQAIVAQVRDRAGNVSEVASTTVVYEPTPSVAPTAPISSTTGTSITITFEPVPGAAGYVIRYSDGTTLFGPLTTSTNSITISDLDPSKTYSFEVAAVNPAGSVSGFTPVTPAPAATPAPAVTEEVLPTGGPEEDGVGTTTVRPTASPSPSPTPAASPSPSPAGEVKADDDDQARDWTRVIVALSILIIAAGVATGGWYLYQWWTTRPNGTPKGKGKGGRW